MQNEMVILEFTHCVVETMDRCFGNVVCTTWFSDRVACARMEVEAELVLIVVSCYDAS